jgi:hypothetical protein
LLPEDLDTDDSKDIPVVSIDEIAEQELHSIRTIQNEYGLKLTAERVRIAKQIFLKKLDQTVHQKLLIQKGVNELEYILLGAISKRKLVFSSDLFEFNLERKYLNGIAAIYNSSHENEGFRDSNKPTAAIRCIAVINANMRQAMRERECGEKAFERILKY